VTQSELHPGVMHHVVNTLGWSDLRPLQRAAIEPVRAGLDCLLLAPTAGGKTEAASFPLLSEMADAQWSGLSVLYITPLRALLNNLHPRLSGYSSWVGRRVGLWHGDTSAGERKRLLADPPDILLTTPESLEAMLVSTSVDHRALFSGIKAVVVDELHAFAGDDRGWHLLSVLQRLEHLAGHHIQRIGLTATVGNPDELLDWLQGGNPGSAGVVVSPEATVLGSPDITIDFVGSVPNAAKVVASLHHGEKRLVFSDSRAQAESMAAALRERGIVTFVSHSSLSAEERRRSEEAFADSRDCVVVATSTLELGIDVGDLDRVIQLESPRTVASFLQRLGRTGRRPGTNRNCLFLATTEETLLRAVALTSLWSQGFVEPVKPPVLPRHIAAQQFLALALQEGSFGTRTWREWWGDLSVMSEGQGILDYLIDQGFLEVDSGMAFIGPSAEKHFGRRHFMELLSAFTSDPQMTVLFGRTEIGSVSPLSLTSRQAEGQPRVLVLSGRTWRVTDIDWSRKRIQVVEHAGAGRSRWAGATPDLSAELTGEIRNVLLGATPPVELSNRAVTTLERVRTERELHVDQDKLVVERGKSDQMWWTFAGTRANGSIASALDQLGIESSPNAEGVRMAFCPHETFGQVGEVFAAGGGRASIDQDALDGLKFSVALPKAMAVETLQARLSGVDRATQSTQSGLVIT
jgi:ATP-dependent Lhr-like helicase